MEMSPRILTFSMRRYFLFIFFFDFVFSININSLLVVTAAYIIYYFSSK